MTLIAASALDVTILLTLALAAVALLRRRSPALRHAVLTAAVAAALAVPLLETMLPAWPLPLLSWRTGDVASSGLRFSQTTAETPTASVAAVATATEIDWMALVLAIWLLGTVIAAASLVVGLLRLRLLMRRCMPIEHGPWREAVDDIAAALRVSRVRLLQSTHASLLVTCGVRRPAIILPATASSWPVDRCRTVLLHEIAHVQRRDWYALLLAEALRTVHWFNPLVWLACRRMRQESEFACDDVVLNGGVDPQAYASHLLEVARLAMHADSRWVAAPAIAHPSTLERRISAMLSHPRNRQPLTRRAGAVAMLATLAIAAPIAGAGVSQQQVASRALPARVDDVTLEAPAAPARTSRSAAPEARATAAAQQTPAQVRGTVFDQSGAVLPGVELTLTDRDFGVRYTAVTDGAGRFAFRELAPSRYDLVAALPGFAPVTNTLPLGPGEDVQRQLTLPLGSLEETVAVGCATGAAGVAPAARTLLFEGRTDAADLLGSARRSWSRLNPPQPGLAMQAAQSEAAQGLLRVGGQIRVPRKLSDAKPQCPSAVLVGAETRVRLSGRIGIDGYMNELRLIEPADGAVPPQEFVDSALDAARQWVFTPTLLNNQPVEVNITIHVAYRRM